MPDNEHASQESVVDEQAQYIGQMGGDDGDDGDGVEAWREWARHLISHTVLHDFTNDEDFSDGREQLVIDLAIANLTEHLSMMATSDERRGDGGKG